MVSLYESSNQKIMVSGVEYNLRELLSGRFNEEASVQKTELEKFAEGITSTEIHKQAFYKESEVAQKVRALIEALFPVGTNGALRTSALNITLGKLKYTQYAETLSNIRYVRMEAFCEFLLPLKGIYEKIATFLVNSRMKDPNIIGDFGVDPRGNLITSLYLEVLSNGEIKPTSRTEIIKKRQPLLVEGLLLDRILVHNFDEDDAFDSEFEIFVSPIEKCFDEEQRYFEHVKSAERCQNLLDIIVPHHILSTLHESAKQQIKKILDKDKKTISGKDFILTETLLEAVKFLKNINDKLTVHIPTVDGIPPYVGAFDLDPDGKLVCNKLFKIEPGKRDLQPININIDAIIPKINALSCSTSNATYMQYFNEARTKIINILKESLKLN